MIRKVSTDFKGQLNFIQQSANNTLVYPCTLTIEDLVIDNYKLKSEQESMKEFVDDEEKVTIKVAKTLNKLVNDHPPLMSWPPKEIDILPNKVSQYIPKLLDVFCNTLLSGQSSASENSRIMRLKNSIAQDIVYCVSGGKTKTPKSVLFPTVVKSLCNNVEEVKLINNYGHGISYNLIEEIETEHALMVINEQKENKVILPNEAFQDNESCCVGLMVADNIDNMEGTLTGSGTSHRVNSIFVQRKAAQEDVSTTEEEEYVQPTKRKCLRSLPPNAVLREIPEYYSGKRSGPGELIHVQKLHESRKYAETNYYQRLNHLIWIEVRKLKTHPALLVPGWTGFQITIRKDMVILESIISYLDTLDSPATDQKTAFEVLCRGCEIIDRLKLKAVVCVFDQAFYAKAIEIFWKNKNVFENLVLMLGGFHLLMMLLGIMGRRYGDAGLRELAVQSEVVAEGSIERVLEGKNYNCAVRFHKVVYEALFRMLLNKFEASLPAHAIDIFQQKEILIESFKLDLCKDGFERIFMSKEFREWNDLLVTHMNETKSKGSDLEKFWLTYLDLCELLLNLILLLAQETGNYIWHALKKSFLGHSPTIGTSMQDHCFRSLMTCEICQLPFQKYTQHFAMVSFQFR